MKLKNFFDSEFKVIAVEEGKGSFKGKAIFVCQTDKGFEFNATPEGTMEHRARLWETRSEHIGKMLTVRYPQLTEDGVPQHGIAVDFRDEEEF